MTVLFLSILCLDAAIATMISDTLGTFSPFLVPSPIFNLNIGQQAFNPILGPLVYSNGQNFCDYTQDELRTFTRGKVVLMDDPFDGHFWSMDTGRDQVECLHNAGALAAIWAYHSIHDPGMGSRVRAAQTLDPDNSIPLMHISFKHVPPQVMERIKLNDNTIIANVTNDHNQWEDLWDSTSFFVLWRVLLPALNFVGLLMGFTACFVLVVLSLRTPTRTSTTKRRLRDFNIRLLLLNNSVISATCATRLLYCFGGPLFSSSSYSIDSQIVLIDFTVVWEAVASLVAIVIFKTWCSFGMSIEGLINKAVGSFVCVTVALHFTFTLLYTQHVSRFLSLTIIIRPVLAQLLTATVAVMYIFRVAKFLRFVANSPTGGTSKLTHRHRARIGFFMVLACVCSVCVVAVVLPVSLLRVALSINQRFALETVLFFSLSLQSCSQVAAFFPSLSVLGIQARRGVGSRDPLIQQLRAQRGARGSWQASQESYSSPIGRRTKREQYGSAATTRPEVEVEAILEDDKLCTQNDNGVAIAKVNVVGDGLMERMHSSAWS